MKLPSLKRLFKRDFNPQYAEVVDAISDILNSNLEVIYEALNRKITFADNMTSTIKELQVITDSNGNASTSSFIVNTSLFIEGLVIIKVTNLTNSASYPTSGVFASFTQSGRTVTVNNITGLPTNSTLLVKVMTIN